MSINGLKKGWKKPVIYLAVAWVGAAWTGYGIALFRYNTGDRPQKVDISQVQVRIGKVTFSDIHWPKSRGAEFRVDGRSETFTIPAEVVPGDAAWKTIEQSIKPGVHIGFKNLIEGLVVLELSINPGTVYQKNVVTLANSIEHYEIPSTSHRFAGAVSVFFGVLILALGILTLIAPSRFRAALEMIKRRVWARQQRV